MCVLDPYNRANRTRYSTITKATITAILSLVSSPPPPPPLLLVNMGEAVEVVAVELCRDTVDEKRSIEISVEAGGDENELEYVGYVEESVDIEAEV